MKISLSIQISYVSNLRLNRKFRENDLVKIFVAFESKDEEPKIRENKLVNNFVVFEFENEPKFRENKLVKNFDFFEHDDEPKIPRK